MGVAAYNRGSALIQNYCRESITEQMFKFLQQTDKYPRGTRSLFQPTVIRNDGEYWHLMNHEEKGWDSFSYAYKSLPALFSLWNIVITGHGKDQGGFFYRVENI